MHINIITKVMYVTGDIINNKKSTITKVNLCLSDSLLANIFLLIKPHVFYNNFLLLLFVLLFYYFATFFH